MGGEDALSETDVSPPVEVVRSPGAENVFYFKTFLDICL